MKKLKRISALLILSLILAACNNQTDTDKNIKTNEETNTVETSEDKMTESSEDNVETTEDEIKTESNNDNQTETEQETNENLTSNNGLNHNGTVGDQAYDTVEIKKLMETEDYTGEKIAFLTFDDGPNNSITPRVLDILKEKGVYGTFFMPGSAIGEETKDIVKRIYDEGNAIATHSYTHDYDLLYPSSCANVDTIVKEEKDTLQELKNILGEDFHSRVFRYPGGHMSWDKDCIIKADNALADLDIHWIDWNTMNGDAQPETVSDGDIARPTSVSEVISNFERSKDFTYNPDIAVILMHDASGKGLTADALPTLIDHLKEQGYKFGILQ